MNFSFELEGAAITGNMSPEVMNHMAGMFGAAIGGFTVIYTTVMLLIATLMIVSLWKIFKKAGLPGWGALIPFYNIVLILQLGGMSGRWILALLFPPLFLVIMIINIFNIAENFGKHWTFGLGILFIKVVFIPILAFDDSKYLAKKTTAKAITKPVTTITEKKIIAKKVVAKKPAKKVVKKVTKKAPAKKVVKKVKTLKTLTKKK